jgi:hypothetical protein
MLIKLHGILLVLSKTEQIYDSTITGVGGFEPPMADPKSAALPLGYTPILFQ